MPEINVKTICEQTKEIYETLIDCHSITDRINEKLICKLSLSSDNEPCAEKPFVILDTLSDINTSIRVLYNKLDEINNLI